MEFQSPTIPDSPPYRDPIPNLDIVFEPLTPVGDQSDILGDHSDAELGQRNPGPNPSLRSGEGGLPGPDLAGSAEFDEPGRQDTVHVVTVESGLLLPQRLFEATKLVDHIFVWHR